MIPRPLLTVTETGMRILDAAAYPWPVSSGSWTIPSSRYVPLIHAWWSLIKSLIWYSSVWNNDQKTRARIVMKLSVSHELFSTSNFVVWFADCRPCIAGHSTHYGDACTRARGSYRLQKDFRAWQNLVEGSHWSIWCGHRSKRYHFVEQPCQQGELELAATFLLFVKTLQNVNWLHLKLGMDLYTFIQNVPWTYSAQKSVVPHSLAWIAEYRDILFAFCAPLQTVHKRWHRFWRLDDECLVCIDVCKSWHRDLYVDSVLDMPLGPVQPPS